MPPNLMATKGFVDLNRIKLMRIENDSKRTLYLILKITIKKTGTTPTASAAPQQEQQASGFMDQF